MARRIYFCWVHVEDILISLSLLSVQEVYECWVVWLAV
jgi:hypothetical protein